MSSLQTFSTPPVPPDSSASSLIQTGWAEGHPATKNLHKYPWVDGDFSTQLSISI